MREYLSDEEDKTTIEQWITNGRTQEEYVDIVQPIMEAYCVSWHPDGNQPDYPLETYEEIFASVEPSAGPSIGKLARFTHYHAFGMKIYAFLLSAIFALTAFPSFFSHLRRCSNLPIHFLRYYFLVIDSLSEPSLCLYRLPGGLATDTFFAITIFGSLYDSGFGL